MPIYNYKCRKCGGFEAFHLMKDSDVVEDCPKCSAKAIKVPSVCNLHTDTSFFATGGYDNRLCDKYDDKIEGRKDWKRRLDKKGLRELDPAEATKKPPTPAPCM